MKFISHTAETAMESITFVYEDTSCSAWVDMEIVKRFSPELYTYFDTNKKIHLHIDDMFTIQSILFNSREYFRSLDRNLIVHVCRGAKHCKTVKNKNRTFARLVDVVVRYDIEDVRKALVDYISEHQMYEFIKITPIDGRLKLCGRGEKYTAFETLKSLRAHNYIMEKRMYFIDQIAEEWCRDQLS